MNTEEETHAIAEAFAEIEGIELDESVEMAAEALASDPYLFISAPYEADSKGYTALDAGDPFFYIASSLSIIYIIRTLFRFVIDTTLELHTVRQLFKLEGELSGPKSRVELIIMTLSIYRELRKGKAKLPEDAAERIANKSLAFLEKKHNTSIQSETEASSSK
ncbi:MAG: hypothetical protein GY847_32665 [Proteobacteria bacterium]|nr:hypothetical protein [Pseudomonadota bacterium]